MSCRTTFPTKNVSPGVWSNIRGASFIIPKPGIYYNFRSQNRYLLRDAWNTQPYVKFSNNQYDASAGTAPKMGGFRVVNNAGDVLSRENYSCGGANMITPRPGILNLTTKDGGQLSDCDDTLVPPSTCNVKYVYDSSDFITYKRLSAVNKGYSTLGKIGKEHQADYSSGGANNGAYTSLNFVRH